MKAKKSSEASQLEDIPNIGKAIADTFKLIGIKTPQHLKGKDAFKLYLKLNKVTGKRYDPCVLDTFIAAVDFMNGGKAKPWWKFTAQRKEKYPLK